MSKIYNLVPLINLSIDLQLQVLEIRNEEHIREWMFTQDTISADDHFNWIEKLKSDQSQICLIILDKKNIPVGSINLKKINKLNKNAELGFYKSNKHHEKGLMTKGLYMVIDYSFCVLELEKIYTEVFEENIKSINIHKKLMFTKEGYLRSHIINKGKRVGVHLYGLLKNEWEINTDKINVPNDLVFNLK